MLIKILIADSCEEFRLALSELLQPRYCVRSCCDGAQALALLESFSPDVLVVDLMLQTIDGLSVIQTARRDGYVIPIVTTSVFYSDYICSVLSGLDIAYPLQKPCQITTFAERIDDLVRNTCLIPTPAASDSATVTAVLLELGMNASRGGFQYTRDAIVMLRRDPGQLLTKDVYPEIAKQYNTSATAVEKNIRDTVAAAWRNTDERILRKYFLPAPNGQVPRPTNHVFLSTLTQRLFYTERAAK